MRRTYLFPLVTVFVLAILGLVPFPAPHAAQGQDRPPDVIFVPTPYPVVEKMLTLANPRPGEVLYDLGCGDGRICVMAAQKYGIKTFGYDIDPARVRDSLDNVERNNVKHLVTIRKGDIFELDLSKADVITLYLLPQLNVKLIPQLDKLKPGCRIVSHDFDMKTVTPKVHMTYIPNDPGSREHQIYLWMTPLQKELGK